jgi:hypothetical protein
LLQLQTIIQVINSNEGIPMNSFSTLRLIIIIDALILLFFSLLWAQSPHIYIEKIASTSPRQNFAKGDTTGVKVKFKRGNNEWQKAFAGLDLLEGDSLEVYPDMHVKVLVKGDIKKEQQAEFTLLPKNSSTSGLYFIQIEKRLIDIAKVVIDEGAMSVKSSGGILSVIWNGIGAYPGSKLMFMRDPETGNSILFLEEGSVSFSDPDYEDIKIEPDEIAVFILPPGQKPEIQKQKPDPKKLKWLKGIVKYNTVYPWAKPFPWYIPAGVAVVAGGGAYLLTRDGKEDTTLPGPPDLPK